MKKAVLGTLAAAVVIGGGSYLWWSAKTPAAEQQAYVPIEEAMPKPSAAADAMPAPAMEAAPTPAPTPEPAPAMEADPATARVMAKMAANVFPEASKTFSPEEVKGSVAFRWTPLVPKPQEPVTYRLRVWQLMQGQNGTQAMRTNQPIVTKDVDNVTEVSLSGIYNGPCKPPYLCDFVWDVTAMSAGGVEAGTSEPTSFSVSDEAVAGSR